MKKAIEKFLGWLVAGIFVVGLYAIAHFMLKADNDTLLYLCIWLLWSDLARFLTRDDRETGVE